MLTTMDLLTLPGLRSLGDYVSVKKSEFASLSEEQRCGFVQGRISYRDASRTMEDWSLGFRRSYGRFVIMVYLLIASYIAAFVSMAVLMLFDDMYTAWPCLVLGVVLMVAATSLDIVWSNRKASLGRES